jgi:hypothetical protein
LTSHPFDSDPVYEQLGVPPRHLRDPHPLSTLLRHLAQSVERLEGWRDRVRAGETVFGGLTPEEVAQDEVLGASAYQDLFDSATAIDAVVKTDLALMPVRRKS